MNFFADEKEWKWLFRNAINWDQVVPLYYPSFPTEEGFNSKEEVVDFLEELVSSIGEWSGTSIAARAEKLDQNGAGSVENGRTIPNEYLQALYKEAKELEVVGVCLPQDLGGLAAPALLSLIAIEQIGRACLSSSTQLAFFTSIADMTHRFMDSETAERIVPKILNFELSGSMCLTEPGCGSDLGMIRTVAVPREDGKYELTGSKFFITNAGGGLGYVLARIKGAPEGLEGISMFLVEQDIPEREGPNYIVAKNEKKMGLNGSFTCEVVYDKSVGMLVGNEGHGFKYMLYLMNEARIAAAMQALGVIEASLSYARKYADERVQFGKSLSELPLMKRNLEDYETERDAIRALLVETISHYDIYQHYDDLFKKGKNLDERQMKEYKAASKETRRRTPLVKYYACETATLLSQRGIQILGGYGYMKEYPVERYHRDSIAPLIYEGTSQIQALMALKDLIGNIMKDPKGYLLSFASKHPLFTTGSECDKLLGKVDHKFRKKLAELLIKNLKPKGESLFKIKNWKSDESIDRVMAHAETICQALSYLETLGTLCRHACKDKERIDLFKRYHNLILPRFDAIYLDWEIRSKK